MAIGITPEEAKEQGLSYEDASAATRNVQQGVETDQAYGKVSDTEDTSIDAAIFGQSKTVFNLEEVLAPKKEDTTPIIADSALIEEAAMVTSLRSVVDPTSDLESGEQVYDQVRTELLTTGESSTVTETYKTLATLSEQIDNQAMLNIIQDPTLNAATKEEAFKQFKGRGGKALDIREMYIESVAARQAEVDLREGKPLDLQFLQDRIEWNQEKRKLVNQAATKFNPSAAAGFAGILELIVPFGEQAFVTIVENAVKEDGYLGLATDLALLGENKQSIINAMKNTPFEKRKDLVRKAIETISNLPGMDFKKMVFLEQLTLTNDYATWERVVDNIVSVMDFGIVSGVVARGLGKELSLMRANPGSLIEAARIASNEEAGLMAIAALKDPTKKTAEAVGASKNEIIGSYVLPKMPDDVVEEFTPDIIEVLDELEYLAKDIEMNVGTAGINYTRQEKLDAVRRTTEEIENVDGLRLIPASSTVTSDGETLSGVAMYTRSKRGKFYDAQEAVDRALDSGIDPAEIRLYRKDPTTKELKEVPLTLGEIKESAGGPALKGGEFFIGRTFSRPFDPRDAAMFGADDVSNLAGSTASGYLMDVSARFDRWFARASVKAKDNATATESRFLGFMKQHITSLKVEEQGKLYNALEKGAEGEGTIWTRSQLASKFDMSEGTIRAYYAYRKLQDVMWNNTNRTYRKSLDSKGMKSIYGLDETDGKQFGAPVAREDAGSVKYVYDVGQSKVIEVTPEYRARVYDDGRQFARMESPIKAEGSRTSHVLVDGKTVKLGELTQSPLPYIKGYYQRSYVETYFLEKVPKNLNVDGKFLKYSNPEDADILRTRYGAAQAAGSSKLRLEAKAREANAALKEDDNYFYNVRLSNEINDTFEQEFKMRNGYQNASRGRKNRLEGDLDGTLAKIEDPVESLIKNIRTFSKYVATDDYMNSAKARWINTYGKASGQNFPTNFNKEVNASMLSAKEYGDARAVHEQINLLNQSMSTTDEAWRKMLLGITETIEGKTLIGKAAGITGKLAEAKPINAIRGLSSTLFISLRAPRQLVLQSGQLLQLIPIMPKYFFSGQGPRELLAMSLAAASRGRKELEPGMRKVGAKLFNTTEDDFDVIIKEYFDRSGIPQSIDSNVFVEALVADVHRSHLDSAVMAAGKSTLKGMKAVVDLSKKVGFDLGEFINLTGTWVTARKRWQENNPKIAHKWAEKQYADEIAADARLMSYAMSQPGKFKYQEGILSVPLQFQSVIHKAFLSMLPEIVGGSKTYTQYEKNKLIAGNIIMFGGAGVGMNALLDDFFKGTGSEYDNDTQMAIRGGVLDLAMNSLLRTLSDDENDGTSIKISDAFSPISEGVIPGFNLLTAFMDKDFEQFLGPSFQAGSKFGVAFNRLRAINARVELDSTTKIIESLSTAASLASGWSDILRTRMALNHKILVSSRGDAIVEATAAEGYAALFGVRTYAEEDAWRLTTSISDDMALAKEWATIIHNAYNTQLLKDPSLDNFDELVAKYNMAGSLLDPHITELAQKELLKLQGRSGTRQDYVVRSLFENATNGPAIRQEMYDRVSSTMLPQETKDITLEFLDMRNK